MTTSNSTFTSFLSSSESESRITYYNLSITNNPQKEPSANSSSTQLPDPKAMDVVLEILTNSSNEASNNLNTDVTSLILNYISYDDSTFTLEGGLSVFYYQEKIKLSFASLSPELENFNPVQTGNKEDCILMETILSEQNNPVLEPMSLDSIKNITSIESKQMEGMESTTDFDQTSLIETSSLLSNYTTESTTFDLSPSTNCVDIIFKNQSCSLVSSEDSSISLFVSQDKAIPLEHNNISGDSDMSGLSIEATCVLGNAINSIQSFKSTEDEILNENELLNLNEDLHENLTLNSTINPPENNTDGNLMINSRSVMNTTDNPNDLIIISSDSEMTEIIKTEPLANKYSAVIQEILEDLTTISTVEESEQLVDDNDKAIQSIIAEEPIQNVIADEPIQNVLNSGPIYQSSDESIIHSSAHLLISKHPQLDSPVDLEVSDYLKDLTLNEPTLTKGNEKFENVDPEISPNKSQKHLPASAPATPISYVNSIKNKMGCSLI